MTAVLEVLAGLRDDVGAWGEHADERQWVDAASILGDGPRRQWWGRTRGWSKTRDASAILLAALLTGAVPPGQPAYCCASDADQARLVVDSIRGFVGGTGLSDRITMRASTITDSVTGGQIIVLPADSAGALGLRPSWVLCDELANWGDVAGPRTFYENVSSGVAKTSGRLLIITTAGTVGHWSQVIHDRAADDPAWRLSNVHAAPPWISEEEIATERRRLPGSVFLRLWENRWSSGEDRLADATAVARCVGHSGPLAPSPGVGYVVAVDLGVKTDPTVGVVAHVEVRDGRDVYVVDRLQRWVPSKGRPVDLAEVQAWVVEINRAYRPGLVAIESWQAFSMLGTLRSLGVPVQEFVASGPSSSRVALALFDAIKATSLDLPDDPELIRELQEVRLVASGGAAERYRLDHSSGKHNDQAVAIGIALLQLMENRPSNYAGLGEGIAAASPSQSSSWADPAVSSHATPTDGGWSAVDPGSVTDERYRSRISRSGPGNTGWYL
jgi:hypothetical protein